METYSKGKTAKRPLEASVALLGSIMESSSRKNKSNIFVPVSRVINYHPPNLDSHFRQTKYTLAQEREYLETRKQKTLETILKMLTKPTTATVKEVSGKDIYLFETSKEMASARGKLVVSNIERQRSFLAKGEFSNKPALPQCILYINNEFINKHIDVMKSIDVPRVAPIYMKKDIQRILDEAQIIEDQIETLESKEGRTASEENLMAELIVKKEAIERELLVPDPKDPVNYEIRRDADYFLALDGQNRFSVIAYLLKELRKLSREINIEVLDICLESELRLLPTRFCSEALTLREYMYKKGLFNDFPQSNSGKVKTKKVLHCGYPERREKAIQISSDSQLSETESQTSSSSNYEESFKSYIENLSKQEELVREQYDEDKVKFIEALVSYMKQLETALKKMDDLSEKTSMELISLLKTFKLPRDRDIDKLIEKLLELKEYYLYQLGYYKKDETLKTHLIEIDRILNDYTKVNQKYLALKEQIEQRKKVESMGVKDMEKLFDSIHSDIDKLSKKTRGHIISTVKKVAKSTNNSGKQVVAAAEAVVRKELDELLQVLPFPPAENEGATQINPEDLVETLHPNERIVARSILSDYVKLSEVDKLSNLVRKAIEELIDLNKHRGKPGYKILLNKIQNELTDLNPLLSAELITLDEFLKESKRISDNIDLLSKQSLVKKRVSMSDIQTLQIIQEKIKNSKRLIERLIADVQASLKGIAGTKQRLNIEVEKKQEEELRKIQLDELEIENEKLIKELEQEEKVIERLRALRKEQPRNEQMTTSFEEKITVATRKQRETIEKLKQLEKIKRALLEGSEEMQEEPLGEEPLGEEPLGEQALERPEELQPMELVEQRGEPSEIRDKRGRNNNSNYERRVKPRRNYEESGVGLRNASQSTTGFTDEEREEELMLTNTEHKLATPTMPPAKKKQPAKKPSTRTPSTRRSTRRRRSQETESESE
jgi:hypothetical protein